MRVLTASLVILIGCGTVPQPECPSAHSLPGESRVREFTDASGSVIARGREAMRGTGMGLPDDPWLGVVHDGEWTYWYPSGQMRARVNYKVTCHTHCCVAGLCPMIHDYLDAQFELWHDSGEKLARGNFVPARVRVDNNCEGGTVTLRGVISPESEFWDKLGNRMTLADARRAELLPPGW
jgi:hypothetical protein